MSVKNKKIIFLDRDGVINKDPGGWTEHGYVTAWEQFIFLPGAVETLKKLNNAGYDIIVISNQAGVAKGHYTSGKLDEINGKMIHSLEKNGVRIKKVYYCTHQKSDNCECRKPKSGLIRQAEEELGINASGSYFIGDKESDMKAGRAAGLKTILVLSGMASAEDAAGWSAKPDHIFKDLSEAAGFIMKEGEK